MKEEGEECSACGVMPAITHLEEGDTHTELRKHSNGHTHRITV